MGILSEDKGLKVGPYVWQHPCLVRCGANIRWAVWRDEKGRRVRRVIDHCDCFVPLQDPSVPLTKAEMEIGLQVARRINGENKTT